MGQFERRRAGNRAGLSLEEMATVAEQGVGRDARTPRWP